MRRHENHSAIILGKDTRPRKKAADSWLALVLVGHHGKFSNFNPTRNTNSDITDIKQIFDTTPWGKIHKALIAQVELGVGMSRDELPDHLRPCRAGRPHRLTIGLDANRATRDGRGDH